MAWQGLAGRGFAKARPGLASRHIAKERPGHAAQSKEKPEMKAVPALCRDRFPMPSIRINPVGQLHPPLPTYAQLRRGALHSHCAEIQSFPT